MANIYLLIYIAKGEGYQESIPSRKWSKSIYLGSSYSTKDTVKRIRRQDTNSEKIFVATISDKGFVIKNKELKQLDNKKSINKSLNKKKAKDLYNEQPMGNSFHFLLLLRVSLEEERLMKNKWKSSICGEISVDHIIQKIECA